MGQTRHSIWESEYFLKKLSEQDISWHAEAACVGVDPDIFFPTLHEGNRQNLKIQEAKSYCQQCPVTKECLEFAIAMHEPGVWGNTTSRERREIIRKRTAQRKAKVECNKI